jgi:nucleotide-binding universal stress UspA family protein
MLIKKILCPIDRSDDAIVGTAYAISLAREHKAELVIFHVTQFPWREMTRYCQPERPLGVEWRSQLTVEHILGLAASRTENFVQKNLAANLLGVSWTIRTSIGNVAREIVAAAVQEEADCIVMAKRKRGILFRYCFPSVSEIVSARAPCPVLSLCPPQIEHFSSDPMRWTRQLGALHQV